MFELEFEVKMATNSHTILLNFVQIQDFRNFDSDRKKANQSKQWVYG
jgi:hypothetical protein